MELLEETGDEGRGKWLAVVGRGHRRYSVKGHQINSLLIPKFLELGICIQSTSVGGKVVWMPLFYQDCY